MSDNRKRAVAGNGKKLKKRKIETSFSIQNDHHMHVSFNGAQILKCCECPWVLVFMDLLSVTMIIGASHELEMEMMNELLTWIMGQSVEGGGKMKYIVIFLEVENFDLKAC
jgi:hypothetical protein